MKKRSHDSGRIQPLGRPLRVLLVEDDPDHAFLIEKTLVGEDEGNFLVRHCSLLAQGLEELSKNRPDVVLLDLGLPDSKGLDTLVEFCECGDNIPVIVLTGAKDELLAVEAVRHGAQDYLPKEQMTPYNLSHVVTFAVERTRRRELLREAEERLGTIVDNSAAGYFRLDRDARFQTVNRSWLHMHGFASRKEVVGMDFYTTLMPKDALEAEKTFRRLLDGESVPRAEFARRRKDGTIGYHVFSANPVRRRGRVVAVEGFLIDVTDQKKAEIDLEFERGQFISLFDGIDEPIYVSDPESFEVLYANKSMKQRFGSIVGEKCHKAIHDLDTPCPFCTNDRVLAHNLGRTHIWEYQNQKNRHWYRAIDRGMRWSDGRIVRSEIAIDITGLKRAEKQLRDRNAQLTAINAIASAANRHLEIEKMQDAALAKACDVLEADGGVIYLTEDGHQTFHAVAFRGMSRTDLAGFERFKVGEGLTGLVAESGRALVIADLKDEPLTVSSAFVRAGWRSYAAAPIECDGRASGVMELMSRQANHFQAHDMDMMRDLGKQISLAVEKARIYEDALMMKATLVESEEKYRRIFELSPEGVLILDPDGNVNAMNERLVRWLGYAREEVEGKNLRDLEFLDEEGRSQAMINLERHVFGRDVPPYELEFRTKSGQTRIGRLSGALLKEGDGEVVGDLMMIADVTEQRRAEEKLRLAQDLMVDNVEFLVWYFADPATVGGGNRAFADFLGCSKDDIGKRSVADFVLQKDRKTFMAETEAVFRNKKKSTTSARFRGTDRLTHEFLLTRAPHLNDDGNVGYVVCSAVELVGAASEEGVREKRKARKSAADTDQKEH